MLATGQNRERMHERLGTWPRYRDHRASMPAEVYGIEAQSIRLFLEVLHREHGGAEEWALANGIGAAAIERVRRQLIED